MAVPIMSGVSAVICGNMLMEDDEVVSRNKPIPKPVKVSLLCQPLYPWIQLDKKTCLSFGRHQETERYHFFMMTRQNRRSPWEELCEIPREQTAKEYPEFIKRIKEAEERRRKAKVEAEQHYQRMSKLRIF